MLIYPPFRWRCESCLSGRCTGLLSVSMVVLCFIWYSSMFTANWTGSDACCIEVVAGTASIAIGRIDHGLWNFFMVVVFDCPCVERTMSRRCDFVWTTDMQCICRWWWYPFWNGVFSICGPIATAIANEESFDTNAGHGSFVYIGGRVVLCFLFSHRFENISRPPFLFTHPLFNKAKFIHCCSCNVHWRCFFIMTLTSNQNKLTYLHFFATS